MSGSLEIDEGPEWGPFRPEAERTVREGDLPAWMYVGLAARQRDRLGYTARRLARLESRLLEAGRALGLPREVRATARLLLEASYRHWIMDSDAYLAVVLRGATVRHAWPVYYREILELLGVDRREKASLLNRYTSMVAQSSPQLWPGPGEWRSMAAAQAQRLSGELGLPYEAQRLSVGLAGYIVSRRDGTKIETAAAAAVVAAGRLWGIPVRYEDAAGRAGVSIPSMRKALSWLIRNARIRVYLEVEAPTDRLTPRYCLDPVGEP